MKYLTLGKQKKSELDLALMIFLAFWLLVTDHVDSVVLWQLHWWSVPVTDKFESYSYFGARHVCPCHVRHRLQQWLFCLPNFKDCKVTRPRFHDAQIKQISIDCRCHKRWLSSRRELHGSRQCPTQKLQNCPNGELPGLPTTEGASSRRRRSMLKDIAFVL